MQIVQLGKLSFREQLLVVQGASVLVGVSGSDLVNGIFLPKQGALVEILPMNRGHPVSLLPSTMHLAVTDLCEACLHLTSQTVLTNMPLSMPHLMQHQLACCPASTITLQCLWNFGKPDDCDSYNVSGGQCRAAQHHAAGGQGLPPVLVPNQCHRHVC